MRCHPPWCHHRVLILDCILHTAAHRNGRIRIGAQSVHFCSVHVHFVFGSKSRANRVRSISLRIFCKAWNSSLRKFAPCTLTLYSVRNYIYIYIYSLHTNKYSENAKSCKALVTSRQYVNTMYYLPSLK